MLERKWSDAQRTEVRRLRDRGYTYGEISKVTGIPGTTVAQILRVDRTQEALRAGSEVSVYFNDGENIPFARIKRSNTPRSRSTWKDAVR